MKRLREIMNAFSEKMRGWDGTDSISLLATATLEEILTSIRQQYSADEFEIEVEKLPRDFTVELIHGDGKISKGPVRFFPGQNMQVTFKFRRKQT